MGMANSPGSGIWDQTPDPYLDLRKIRHFLPVLQLHVRLLPIGAVARETAPAAQLAFEAGGPHFGHLHLEELLYRRLHLRLVGRESHFEAQGALIVLLVHALLGHERA